jgi:hypothetical protein
MMVPGQSFGAGTLRARTPKRDRTDEPSAHTASHCRAVPRRVVDLVVSRWCRRYGYRRDGHCSVGGQSSLVGPGTGRGSLWRGGCRPGHWCYRWPVSVHARGWPDADRGVAYDMKGPVGEHQLFQFVGITRLTYSTGPALATFEQHGVLAKDRPRRR